MATLDGVYIFHELGHSLLAYPVDGVQQPMLANLGRHLPQVSGDAATVLELSPAQLMYRRRYEHLYFLVPFGTNIPPLVIENLVDRIIASVESYLGATLTPNLIARNQASVVLILSEMLGAGFPRITEPNIVNQLLPKDDLLTLLLTGKSAATASASGGQSAISAAAAGRANFTPTLGKELPDNLVPWEYPWRTARARHMREELFVDIVETVRMVRGARKRSVGRASVRGEIKLCSKLTGTPQVTLNLENIPNEFAEATHLHPCVDYSRFKNSGGRTLTCIPPDGPDTIAEYTAVVNERDWLVSAELVRSPSTSMTEGNPGAFELKIATAINLSGKSVSNLHATVVFPLGTRQVKELASTSGDFNVTNPQRCELQFAETVPTGWNAVLRAVGHDAEGAPVQPLYIEVRYGLLGRVPSRLTVKSVQIVQNKEPAYKGIRYATNMDSYVLN